MKNPIFTGAAVAIITPMNEDGTVNYDEFAKFIDFQIENGTDAIAVLQAKVQHLRLLSTTNASGGALNM